VSDKAEAKDSGHDRSRTPFERFRKFVRAVVAVPKKELPAQERVYQQQRKRKRKTKHGNSS